MNSSHHFLCIYTCTILCQIQTSLRYNPFFLSFKTISHISSPATTSLQSGKNINDHHPYYLVSCLSWRLSRSPRFGHCQCRSPAPHLTSLRLSTRHSVHQFPVWSTLEFPWLLQGLHTSMTLFISVLCGWMGIVSDWGVVWGDGATWCEGGTVKGGCLRWFGMMTCCEVVST